MKSIRGFTLLEMVVAIGIFAIIAAISYTSLSQFLETRDVINSRSLYLKSLQSTMTLMERDMRFMVNRAVRDGFGDNEPALLSVGDVNLGDGEIVRLTTSQPDPELGVAPRLQRVAWRLTEGKLQRVTWTVLDRDQDSRELVRTLLEGVDSALILYYFYSEEGTLENEAEWTNVDAIPAGVEFVLTMEGGRQYSRLLAIAGSS